MLKMSELSRRQCSFLLTIGVEDSVLLPWAAQYFWAIEFAQFLKAASFEVVAKLVELVQIACAEALSATKKSTNGNELFGLQAS